MAKKIYRSRTDKVLSGVCGGLGEYFNIDPSIIRFLWVLLAIATEGAGIIAYIICATIIPEGDNNVIYYDSTEDKTYKNSAMFVGIVLIITGAILLLKKVWPMFNVKWFHFRKYWPILLIVAGIYVIYLQKKEK